MERFEVGFRLNQKFNHLVAIYFTAEGGGAALMLTALFFKQSTALLVGFLMVLAGVVSLLLDLGQPSRFWRSITKPDRSWISRGSLFVGCLIVFGGLYTLFPDVRTSSIGEALRLITALLCLLTITYTGLLLASFKSVPSWSHSLVPQLFVLHSFTTGLIIARFILSLTGLGNGVLPLLEVLLLASTLGLTYVYYRTNAKGGEAQKESATILARGEMKYFFFHGAVLIGLVLPLVLAVFSYFGSPGGFWNSGALLAMAMLTRLAGDFCYRYSVLRSGVYKPLFSLTMDTGLVVSHY